MKVKFVPQNVEFEIEPGKSVMHVAQDHGLYVKSVCKGVPNCAECRVRIVEGEHNVMPPGSEELSLIGTGHFIDRRRLSCQLRCFGDITVDMSEQLAKQQGLILGNKKKAALKDDRVEEAVARRGENAVDEETSNDANGDVVHQNAPRPSRDPRDARETRETRDTRPPGDRGKGRGGENRNENRGQNRGGQQPGARPQGDGSSRSHRGGGPTEGGGDRSPRGAREAVPGHSPAEAAGPGSKPGAQRSQQQGQQPQAPRQERQQTDPRSTRAEGDMSLTDAKGEGGGKRRRRRRGKGGGGGSGGGGSGGAPGGASGGGGTSGGPPAGRPGGGSRPGSVN